MNGFGKDLRQEAKNTRLYRKVDFENFSGIRGSGNFCFSTDDSQKLIEQGEFAIILEKGNYNGCYTPFDADAGKNYGYDEFRVEIDDISELIEDIVIPDKWKEQMEDENFEYADDPDIDPAVWIDNIMEELGVNIDPISASTAKKRYNIDFNF